MGSHAGIIYISSSLRGEPPPCLQLHLKLSAPGVKYGIHLCSQHLFGFLAPTTEVTTPTAEVKLFVDILGSLLVSLWRPWVTFGAILELPGAPGCIKEKKHEGRSAQLQQMAKRPDTPGVPKGTVADIPHANPTPPHPRAGQEGGARWVE